MQVPFLNIKRQVQELRIDLDSALAEVLDGGGFILGKKVVELEGKLASLTSSQFAVACNSGTDALYLALVSLGVKPGDEVVTTPFTFFSTAASIVRAGAKPVFADIDPETLNLSVDSVRTAITDKTTAIIPVHIFGYPADMDGIMDVAIDSGDLYVIEDAAQAIGAKYKGHAVGSIGDCAILSFYPTKNIGAAGDAGVLLAKEWDVAMLAGKLRNHGSDDAVNYELIGICSRMDAFQAAVLLAKLPTLKEKNARRRQIAGEYTEAFADLPLKLPPTGNKLTTHVYHHYTVQFEKRDDLALHLSTSEIGTGIYYKIPLNLQPCFASYSPSECPEAERAAAEVLQLPVFPELTNDEVSAVITAVTDFFK